MEEQIYWLNPQTGPSALINDPYVIDFTHDVPEPHPAYDDYQSYVLIYAPVVDIDFKQTTWVPFAYQPWSKTAQRNLQQFSHRHGYNYGDDPVVILKNMSKSPDKKYSHVVTLERFLIKGDTIYSGVHLYQGD